MIRKIALAAAAFLLGMAPAPASAGAVLIEVLGARCAALPAGQAEVCPVYVGIIAHRYQISESHAKAGRPDQAISWLEQAHEWIGRLQEDCPGIVVLAQARQR